MVEVISKLLCSGLLLFQGLFLDAYLAKAYKNDAWWTWAIADVAVLVLWVYFLVHAKRQFTKTHADEVAAGEAPHEIKVRAGCPCGGEGVAQN